MLLQALQQRKYCACWAHGMHKLSLASVYVFTAPCTRGGHMRKLQMLPACAERELGKKSPRSRVGGVIHNG